MERDIFRSSNKCRWYNFNSHAHVERDWQILPLLLHRHYFNSHAHVERDLDWFRWVYIFYYFNSHAHVERDFFLWWLFLCLYYFNSHAHVERDRSALSACPVSVSFQLTRSRGAWLSCRHVSHYRRHFNSHAHVERDSSGVALYSLSKISTHTLTWSVTLPPSVNSTWCKISTHTLTWSVTSWLSRQADNEEFQLTRSRGAWLSSYDTKCASSEFQLTRSRGAWQNRTAPDTILCYFNSHAHVERDRAYAHSQCTPAISTHTLTWSVTRQVLPYTACRKFQLTRSRGAWHWQQLFRPQIPKFQLTRSRGAWPNQFAQKSKEIYFNSHAHVERDFCRPFPTLFRWKISTHTLTWSVTKLPLRISFAGTISTHTLTWSVTPWYIRYGTWRLISTHTLTWSVTQCYH